MRFQSYYKMMAPQTPFENCVAHNGSLIPIPGRDVMVQGWYQGCISVFEWTDPAHPKEIAFFDRGPIDGTQMGNAGTWSAYWYNGHIYSSEIGRGLDVLELTPSGLISANEIAVDGSPTTFALLFATSMSSGDASSLCAAIATIRSRRIFAVSLTAPAVIDPLRLPAAPAPKPVTAVSPWIVCTSATSTPSASAVSWITVVSMLLPVEPPAM